MMIISRLSFSVRGAVRRLSTAAALVDEKASIIPTKDLVRFRNQNIKWNVTNFKTQLEACASGLHFMGVGKSTKILSLMPTSAEQVVLALAATSIGANFMQVNRSAFVGDKAADIVGLIKATGAGLVYIPGNEASINVIKMQIPELSSTGVRESKVKLSKLPELKYLVHSGLTLERGINRYRDLLTYYAIESNPIEFNDDGKFSIVGLNGKVEKEMDFDGLSKLGASVGKEIGIGKDKVATFATESKSYGLDGVAAAVYAMQEFGMVTYT